jgi:AcrR family transcriptional regulator
VAARHQFVAAGFEGASVRSIAAEAGVDPSLVIHYFGSKDRLLGAVMAWPIDLDEIAEQVVAPGPDGVGERLVRFFLAQWDDPSKRHPLTVIVRNAVSHEEAARLLGEFVRRELVGQIVPLVGEATAELRGSLVASALVGVAMTRYVVGLEPLASAPADVVVAAMAPTIQRFLTGDLTPG